MAAHIPYKFLDRCLHNVAFGSVALREILEDLEASLFSTRWQHVSGEGPVFITSLPRAGTTILLKALAVSSSFSVHTYRDMPFVSVPVLWSKVSGLFFAQGEDSERAHGDGLSIGFDSPEAFEEILWVRFFSELYHVDRIELLRSLPAGFCDYFRLHMKKVICSRRNGVGVRYLSKNNANISRLDALSDSFPDARILIPFRDPLEHAASLRRQHVNFSRLHSESAFSCKYMSDLGHYEFGELHRPVDFPGFFELKGDAHPESLDYWLAYWISAFTFLLSCGHGSFLSYERLCDRPFIGLSKVAELLSCDLNIDEAGKLFQKTPGVTAAGDFDSRLVELARETHSMLLGRCILEPESGSSPNE